MCASLLLAVVPVITVDTGHILTVVALHVMRRFTMDLRTTPSDQLSDAPLFPSRFGRGFAA